jgi:hypothetical protein
MWEVLYNHVGRAVCRGVVDDNHFQAQPLSSRGQ